MIVAAPVGGAAAAAPPTALGPTRWEAPQGDGLHRFDTLRLRDQDGRALTLAELRGSAVLLNFVFTGCSASCSMQTTELVALKTLLLNSGRAVPVRFLSVSLDPMNDTPKALKAFAEARGATFDRWSFVTAEPAQAAAFARAFDVVRPSDPMAAEGHSTDVRLYDASGHLLQRYRGVPLDRERLVRDIGAAVTPGSTVRR